MRKYWKEIEQMGWGTRSTDYTELAKEFYAKWGKRKRQAVRRFAGKMVSKLYLRVDVWKKQKNQSLNIGSDDGFNDVLYHIVGLGEKAFDAAMANPVLIEKRYNSDYGSAAGYKESFAYAFHEPEPIRPKTILNKPAVTQWVMLRQIAEKFSWESKETLIDRLMEYYSNMPFSELAAYYKEMFPERFQ